MTYDRAKLVPLGTNATEGKIVGSAIVMRAGGAMGDVRANLFKSHRFPAEIISHCVAPLPLRYVVPSTRATRWASWARASERFPVYAEV
jgi:hypothetical protein